MMKRKRLLTGLLLCLLMIGFSLLVPNGGTWAVPGQHPQRQSIPTLTPTPAAREGGPGDSEGSPAPAVTVPPLELTPLAAIATLQASGDWTPWPTREGADREAVAITRSPSPAQAASTPSKTPLPDTSATPIVSSSSRSVPGSGVIVDLIVMGVGLTLLLIGLVLVAKRRHSSES